MLGVPKLDPLSQTFDKDDIAVDGKLDDYTGSKIDGHTSVVVTKERAAPLHTLPRHPFLIVLISRVKCT